MVFLHRLLCAWTYTLRVALARTDSNLVMCSQISAQNFLSIEVTFVTSQHAPRLHRPNRILQSFATTLKCDVLDVLPV